MAENDVPEQWETSVTIAIVGMGVRGLCILERLLSHAALHDPALTVRVHLVDSSPARPRQYATDQPDYLLLNHACGHVSMFPATRSVAHAPAMRGPSLFDWAHERGMRVASDGLTVGNSGRQIESADNLPRRVFGEYLLWFYEQIRAKAPANVHLLDHVSDAAELTQEGSKSILRLANDDRIEADYVFVTIGQRPQQAQRNRGASASRLIRTPYPLPGQLASVQPGETVAIAGLGLTAADAIFALTVGRGGRFDQTVSPERYVPSGREPLIVVFSRSGLPYRARPTPSPCVSYEPVALTKSAIDRLRTRTPLLDFDHDVLPLILLELRVAYRRATLLRAAGGKEAEMFLLSARAIAARGDLPTWADLPEPAECDAEAVYRGGLIQAPGEPSPLTDGDAYQRSLEAWMAADLADAASGFEGSPVKAAAEICREFRDVIRYAVDFGGLTDTSLDQFYAYHVEAINRLIIGPQKERSADILALLRSGIVAMPLGPDPLVLWDESDRAWSLSSTALLTPRTSTADWLYHGYSDRLRSLDGDKSIVGAMARNGIVRRFRPKSDVVRTIDVDDLGHPVNKNGNTESRIWIFGLLCEGATFYNGYLTSPERFERAQFDADRAVNELIEQVRPERQIMTALDGGARL